MSDWIVAKKMTTLRLSMATGLTVQAINSIRQGRRPGISPWTRLKLSEALGISEDAVAAAHKESHRRFKQRKSSGRYARAIT